MDERKISGCQESCPLGKVLGQKECPGKRAKERFLGWLRRQPREGEAKEAPPVKER
jgi:hypothetical protein